MSLPNLPNTTADAPRTAQSEAGRSETAQAAAPGTDAISAVWFLHAEDGKPLGRAYMPDGAPQPVAGMPAPDAVGGEWRGAEIAAVRELAPTCAMRRFRVTLRARG